MEDGAECVAVIRGDEMRFTTKYRHEKYKLEKEIRGIEDAHALALKKATGDEYHIAVADMMSESEYAREMLEELESVEAEKRAKRWGVIIEPAWYNPDHRSLGLNRLVLESEGRLRVARAVRDAKRESIKWWVTVVIMPILTVLMGLTGAVIGVLAFLHKKC
jgi:hypothetical protein